MKCFKTTYKSNQDLESSCETHSLEKHAAGTNPLSVKAGSLRGSGQYYDAECVALATESLQVSTQSNGACRGRCFAVTAKRKFAMIHPPSRLGDFVCAIEGFIASFIVRRSGRTADGVTCKDTVDERRSHGVALIKYCYQSISDCYALTGLTEPQSTTTA
jgi:hypothetical protein